MLALTQLFTDFHSATVSETARYLLTTMQSSKFPIEVCERVIDYFPFPVCIPSHYDEWDDISIRRETLYACSLVCRDWVHRSQHHLFRSVELCDARQADAFFDVLKHSPQRALLVQQLRIEPRRRGWPHQDFSPTRLYPHPGCFTHNGGYRRRRRRLSPLRVTTIGYIKSSTDYLLFSTTYPPSNWILCLLCTLHLSSESLPSKLSGNSLLNTWKICHFGRSYYSSIASHNSNTLESPLAYGSGQYDPLPLATDTGLRSCASILEGEILRGRC